MHKPILQRIKDKLVVGAMPPVYTKCRTPCLLWTGSTPGGTYGQIYYEGRLQVVHRVVWKLLKGSIPKGKNVLHKCDITTCVRHLFLGSQKENVYDCIRKGRQSKGKKHSIAVKLTHAYCKGEVNSQSSCQIKK